MRDEDTRNLSFVFRGLIEEVRSQRYKKGEKCFLFFTRFHPILSLIVKLIHVVLGFGLALPPRSSMTTSAIDDVVELRSSRTAK